MKALQWDPKELPVTNNSVYLFLLEMKIIKASFTLHEKKASIKGFNGISREVGLSFAFHRPFLSKLKWRMTLALLNMMERSRSCDLV